jgi:hypothetical protein
VDGADGGGVQGSSWRRRRALTYSFLPTTAGNPRAQGLRYSLLRLEHRSTVPSHSAQCIRHNLMQLRLSVLQVTRVAVDWRGR